MAKKKIREEATKTEEIVKEVAQELLRQLSVEAEIAVEKGEDHFKVNIQTPDTGLLIGRHGETLNSLQLLLGVILYKKIGSWQRIILDVGSYRKMREDSLREMVERIAIEVETTGQPVVLPFMTPLERRFVHMLLADREKVTTESLGEGRERRLTVKPRA